MKYTKEERRRRNKFYVILFSASIHIFAATICLAPNKYRKLLHSAKWSKIASQIVNRNKRRKCKGRFGVFEI